MGARKPVFDWSILDRDGLANYLWELHPEIVNQELTTKKFHSLLYKHITKVLPVKVSKKSDYKVELNYVFIGGTYYSDYDKERKKCIEVVLVYNPFYETVKMTKKRFQRLCYCFSDTILHEIIHMRQFRRRKFKDLPEYESNAAKSEQRQEQSYLGCSDEIDAYGFNIACELMDRFDCNQNKVIKHLSLDQRGLRTKGDCWRMYLKAFGHDHNHEIIKRVKKKVIRYLPHAESGKPYRNKDWISR